MSTTEWLALVQILVTAPIAFYVAVVSRNLTLLQGEREVRNAWLNFDLAILQDGALLDVTDHRLHPGDERPDQADRRWRWVNYAVRNPLENFYMALRRRHRFWWSQPICCDPSFNSLRSSLAVLVQDDDFMQIVNEYSADPHFAWLCLALRDGEPCDTRPEGAPYPRRRGEPRAGRQNHRCLEPSRLPVPVELMARMDDQQVST